MHLYAVLIPIAMMLRILRLSGRAGALVYYQRLRPAVFRAALIPWIEKADHSSLEHAREEIRRSEPEYLSLLFPFHLALSTELSAKIDGLREKLGGDLSKDAKGARSAFLRTALARWLEDAERDPRAALEEILAELVKRGRKPNQ